MLLNKVFDFWNKSIDHDKNINWDSNKYVNLKFKWARNQLKHHSKSFNDSRAFIWQFDSNDIFIFISFWSCESDIWNFLLHFTKFMNILNRQNNIFF
jgi:hypothetical protein